MKIQNVKGGYDFLPNEQKVRNYINKIISKNFELYGFKNIETPILTYLDILTDKYDENNDIVNEIYKLKDQGNRDLGLRYDLTVPFAKFIAINKNRINMPFKRYEIAKVFRDGPVKVGRDREFTQCDADVVGIPGQNIEAELLSIFTKIFKELGIDIYIKYNSRKLMNGLIMLSGCKEDKVSEITTILDKKDKVSKEDLEYMLYGIGLTKEEIDNLNYYFNLDMDSLLKIKESNELVLQGLEELNNLKELLKAIELDKICLFDITLARGQNYYTGNVFEVYDKDQRLTGSIAAGGRYDNMITDFINDGESYPAVGISFGLSSIYEILKDKKLETSNKKVFVIPMEEDAYALKVANILRNNNYEVEVQMIKKKLGKALDYANKMRFEYVIIIGSEEVKNNIVILKDMINKTQKEFKIDDLYNIRL